MTSDQDTVTWGPWPAGQTDAPPEPPVPAQQSDRATDDPPAQPPATRPVGRVESALTPGQLPDIDVDAPLLPDWMRSWPSVKRTARRFARRNGKRALRLMWALPKVLVLLVAYSPRGLARVTAVVGKYLYDFDSAEVRHGNAQTGGKEGSDAYVKVQNVRKANLKARWLVALVVTVTVTSPALAYLAPSVLGGVVGLTLCIVIVKAIPGRSMGELGIGVVVGAAAGFATWWGCGYLPPIPVWPFVLAGIVAVLALGWHGRPLGKSLAADLMVDKDGPPPLRADLIVGALCSLGSAKMKEPESVRLIGDLHRNGPGVQGEFELPPGVTAKYVMENREAFAASLRHPLGTVWPSVGKRHPGHLIVFVSDEVLAAAEQEEWPLLRQGEVDLFKPQPNFTDQRNEWVGVTLAYANAIIGAVPRMGKTYVLRQLGLVAALDPRAKLYVYDGKATGDLASLSLVAHSYVRGARVDRPEQIEQVRSDLREIRKEMGRRADLLDSLPRELVPESKVTSELCNKRPDLNLGPIVYLQDETQMYLAYGSSSSKAHKEIRTEIREGLTEMVKLGPALGIIVVLATQQVNQETVPSAIANNAVIRYCLKMEGYEANDRILGTGSYKRGLDATMFDIDDKAIGYLKSEGSTPRIVRSVVGLDAVASEKVAARARAVRAAAGRLTGFAAGEKAQEEEQQIDFLTDCRQVMDEQGERRAHLATLREWLSDLPSGAWGQLDVDGLGAMLRNAGVPTPQVKVGGRTTTGVKREHLNVAATDDVDPDTVGLDDEDTLRDDDDQHESGSVLDAAR